MKLGDLRFKGGRRRLFERLLRRLGYSKSESTRLARFVI